MTTLKTIGTKILDGWRAFSHILGRINTTIIFTIIYIVIFGAYWLLSLPFRLMGLWRLRHAKTFWKEKSYHAPTVERMTRPF